MSLGETEVFQRTVHHSDTDDDISYSSGADSDSDYGADHEDNAEAPDDRDVLQDPGPFRYNRKLFLTSLPCSVMLLGLVGEIFLITVSFGAGLIIILDPKGEQKRCLILFTSVFVFCHAFTIYSVIPLLWLSVFNLVLIGVINLFVILTGGLAILQLSYFRKHETTLAVTIEQMLFSVYPGLCITLLTWATSSVVRWEIIPYVFLVYGFVYLQMYVVPHTSSFRLEREEEEEELDVLSQWIILFMLIVYCVLPSMLHLALHAINVSLYSLLTFTTLFHLIFVVSLSVFLTTMMSLRQLADYLGWQHSRIVLARWVSGAVCCLLCYPVLQYYQLSSHFLPWLPAGVIVYSMYGVITSDKKFKTVSLLSLPVPTILMAYWLSCLPWTIVFDLMFGVHLTTLYVLLLVNCVVCFLCVYSVSHWLQRVTETLLLTESLVFCWCEMLLYNVNLCSRAFLVITAAVALYTFHRLHVSSKISLTAMTICSAVHVSKALVVIIYSVMAPHDELSIFRCFALYFLSAVFIRVVSLDTRAELSFKAVVQNMVAMCVAIVINSYPILYLLCMYILWGQPTPTDLMGLCITTCGACLLVVGSLHLQADAVLAVRQIAMVTISFGVLVLVLQPALSMTWWSVVQWGEVGSVVLIAVVVLTSRVSSLTNLFLCAAIAGVCPAIRFPTMLYSYEDEASTWLLAGRIVLYVPATAALLSLLFIFIKFEIAGRILDKCIFYLCLSLGCLSVCLLVLDFGNREHSESLLSLPAWKLFLVTTAVVSVALKLISTTQNLLIPLAEDKKEKSLPRLPLIGNISTVVTFLLACVQSPAEGFFHDIWCCGAALILVCLQKDQRMLSNLRQDNQMVPTIFTCISILVVSSYIHTDLWTASSLAFLRALVEVLSLSLSLPVFYVLWAILWQSCLPFTEKVVVFLLPMHAVYLLYGSTYTCQALSIVGLSSAMWMMANKLPLVPYQKDAR